MSHDPPAPCGFLNLNKPRGVTSRDVVNQVVRQVGRRVKVGHAGTLDPLATGVLVVAVGPATRLVELVQDQPKVYRTVVRLGARSDTLDADGSIIESSASPITDETAIRRALARQVGTIPQVPPGYSALKVGGKRAYELARSGRTVELAPREVRIDRIDLLSFDWPRLALEIACGGGTYIRSIARDIGEDLGCGGLVEVLERTRIGSFTIEAAHDPTALTPERVRDWLQPMRDALDGLPQIIVSDEQANRLARGMSIEAAEPTPAGPVALLSTGGEVVALAEADPPTGRLLPRKVFAH